MQVKANHTGLPPVFPGEIYPGPTSRGFHESFDRFLDVAVRNMNCARQLEYAFRFKSLHEQLLGSIMRRRLDHRPTISHTSG